MGSRYTASRGLFHRPRVARQSGAADVAHFGAVEAAGAVHRRAVVPHDEVVGPPCVRIDERARRRMLGQVAQEHAPFGDRPADDRAGVRGEEQ